MNTFLLKDDNTIVATSRSTIMEKSNAVDEIEFIVHKTYNGFDMEEFDLILEYRTPITHSVKYKTLQLVDNEYKTEYLRYTLPSTAVTITGEAGDVEMNISFVKAEMDPDGNLINRVRNFTPIALTIVPLSSWFSVSDDGLSQLADLYLANKAQIEAISHLANQIYSNKSDDIGIDVENNKVRSMNNGAFIGEGISIEELNQKLVETGGDTTGNVRVVKI